MCFQHDYPLSTLSSQPALSSSLTCVRLKGSDERETSVGRTQEGKCTCDSCKNVSTIINFVLVKR